MRRALVLVLISIGCASAPPEKQRGYELPPALAEVFRNGELKGLQQDSSALLGMPNDSELVQRVCVSKPQFNLYGQYVTTYVKCW
jgi:hypothetical protein